MDESENRLPIDNERPVVEPGVTGFPLDDELVVCREEGGEVFVLNSTGARVLGLCDGEHTVDAIARELADQYGVPLDQLLADVREVLTALRNADLIRLAPRDKTGS